MVQKVKDRIIGSIIMIVTGVVVSIFSVSFASNRLEDKDFVKKVDGKLDKNIFINYTKDHKTDHLEQENRIIQHFDSRFEDFKDFMIELNKK